MDVPSYLLGKQAGGGGGQPSLQNKSVTITENGTQNIIADSGYDGLSNVNITTNVPSGEDLSKYFKTALTSNTNDTNNIFTKIIKKIPAISINNQVTSLAGCFRYCAGLTSLDLSNFDTQKITNMKNMFAACSYLSSLNLSSFNTSIVTNMSSMFSDCTRLTSLDLSSFYTNALKDTSNMFYNCRLLEFIDMRNFNFSSITSYTNMFGETTFGVPDDCEIIVADNTAKTWITDKFTRLTNVKTVAEYEAE